MEGTSSRVRIPLSPSVRKKNMHPKYYFVPFCSILFHFKEKKPKSDLAYSYAKIALTLDIVTLVFPVVIFILYGVMPFFLSDLLKIACTGFSACLSFSRMVGFIFCQIEIPPKFVFQDHTRTSNW